MKETAPVSVPMEVVAAITAAIAACLDTTADHVVIKRIEPEPQPVAAGRTWAKAGLLEAHLARRQFGLRTR